MRGTRVLTMMLATLLMLVGMTACAEPVTVKGFSADSESTEIDLGETQLKMDELTKLLDRFPKLRKCDMFATPVTEREIESLIYRYPEVTFGWTVRVGNHTVRTDQTAFSTLHEADEEVFHHSSDFGALKYCKRLKALDLGHNDITDIGFLYDLPELRVLILACNRVSDLTPIAGLEHLEYLELFTNRIADITPLKDLDRLMDLNLGYNAVGDYSPLYFLHNLERLWIGKASMYAPTKVLTDAALDELKRALPNVTISRPETPTGDGWRKSPHFDVIREMFAKGEYIPFADGLDAFVMVEDEE